MQHRITLLVGLLISAASLWWVFKGVAFGELLASLAHVRWIAVFPSLVFFYLSMYLRAVRWAVFFRPRWELSGVRLFRPVMIGFAFNCILPAHAGEAIRALYVGRREQTGTATAMATIVAERLFDVLSLLLCLGASLWFLPRIQPDLAVSVWGVTVRGAMIDENLPKLIWAAMLLFGIVSLMLVPGFVPALARSAARLPRLSTRVVTLLTSIFGGIETGLAPLKDVRNLMAIMFYSISIWLGVTLSMWTLAFGFPGVRLDFWQTMATMSVVAVFTVVPSAPGYWGLFEAAVVFMLLALGVQEDKSIATAYAIAAHLVQYVPLLIVGMVFAAQARGKAGVPSSRETMNNPG